MEEDEEKELRYKEAIENIEVYPCPIEDPRNPYFWEYMALKNRFDGKLLKSPQKPQKAKTYHPYCAPPSPEPQYINPFEINQNNNCSPPKNRYYAQKTHRNYTNSDNCSP